MKRFLFTTVLMFAAAPVMAQSVCKVGEQSAAFGYWSWASESVVKVYVVQTDFEDGELPFLLAPLASWNAVSSVTGSKVRFEYEGTTTASLSCPNCLTIRRGPVFDKTNRHLTELRTYGVAGSKHLIAWATIVIDPRLTNPKTLTNAVAHELGHSFGLLDCYSCRARSSVMVQFKSPNVSNEMDGPTPCDVAQVRTAYKLLAQLKPAVNPKKKIDEGEEPVDDDTPIVVPRPVR